MSDISWYPVNGAVLTYAAKIGSRYRRRVICNNICFKCGGITVDFIRDNTHIRYNDDTIVCVCRYGKRKLEEMHRRKMGVNIVRFLGGLRNQVKGLKMPRYWPTINIPERKINFGNAISAFSPYRDKLTLDKIAGYIEKNMIEILVG